MGRQSSRLWFGSDHKDIYYNGNYHKAMYLTDSKSKPELVWEKLENLEVVFSLIAKPTYSNNFLFIPMSTTSKYSVDWGDGTVNIYTENNAAAHEYKNISNSAYTVKIYGDVQNIVHLRSKAIYEILTPFPTTMSNREDFSDFFGDSSVEYVCGTLFENCKSAKNFATCFNNSKLREIPDGLFSYCPNAQHFGSCFNSCDKLVKIGKDIFKNCSNALYFSSTFRYAPIREIPEGIFDDCVLATTFESCFYSCGTQESGVPQGLIVPDGLFSHAYSATNFVNCFANIIFKKGDVVEYQTLNRTFQNCMSATNFARCFKDSTGFEIGEQMFDGCTEVIYFTETFSGTHIRSIPSDLFDDSQKVEYFVRTFDGCSGVTGNVPELWTRDNVLSKTDCFNGCVNATNYDDIPNSWK